MNIGVIRRYLPLALILLLLISILLTGCAETPSNRLPESDASPSQSAPTPEPGQPKTSSSAFRLSDVVEHPEYWNADWGASKLYQLLCSINSLYHKEHNYVEGVFDCNDMAVDIWDILHQQGITSIIGVGNLSVDKESFAECDHAWLIIIHKDELITV
jgi:hypothetical protein